MSDPIAAIPTVYRGIAMRSRLEAKWAACFDALEIRWSYEPSERPGWIPDFQIGAALLDAKPWAAFDHAFTTKLEAAGEPAVSYVLGECPTWPRWAESLRQVGWDAYGVSLMLGRFRSTEWGFLRMRRDEDGRLIGGAAYGFDEPPVKLSPRDLSPTGGLLIDDAWRGACNAARWLPRPEAPTTAPVAKRPALRERIEMPPADDEDLFQ